MKNMTHFVAMVVLFAAAPAIAQQPAPVKIDLDRVLVEPSGAGRSFFGGHLRTK